jgi:hypothetical protein
LTAQPGKPNINQFPTANGRVVSLQSNSPFSGVLTLPGRTLAAYCAGTAADKICANAQKYLARLENPCDVLFGSSGITRSPHNGNKEKKKEKI